MTNNDATPHSEPGQPDHQDRQDPAKSLDLKEVVFVVLMLALTAMLVFFGSWHLSRLDRQQGLLAIFRQRVENTPIGLPPVAEWVGFDPEIYNFRPLRVSGTFDQNATVLVSINLLETTGSFSGPGYWVMAPLYLEGGGVVFVNRGFVPEQSAARFKQGGGGGQGVTTITGLGRLSEPVNNFTPGTDYQNQLDWVRNVERLSQFLAPGNVRVAPIFIDAGAGAPGALPQGGQTRVGLDGRHLQYMLIWFSLAAITPLMSVFWLFSNRKRPSVSPPEV